MAEVTRATILALKPAEKGLAYLWDSSLPGFGVRISEAGVKSFVLRYRISGRQRIKTIGRTTVLDLSKARAQAQTRLATLYKGEDPFNNRAAVETIDDLAKAFQLGRKEELKPKTLEGYKSLWAAHIVPALGNRAIDQLHEMDASTLRKKVGKKHTTFNRCCALIITALKWHGTSVENHPFEKAAKYKEKGRERILTEPEMARLHASFSDYKSNKSAGWQYCDLFAMLLLTALRRDEWRLGRWEWIHWADCIYTLPDNKTGGRVVYLPQLAIKILADRWAEQGKPKTGFIFPSQNTRRKAVSWTWRTWNDMRGNLDLQGFTIHDMRRTAGSYAHSKGGLSQRQVADLLGHKRMETSSRYIRDNEKMATAEAAAGAVSKHWQKS